MRVHKLTFAALAVAAGLSLAACQNSDSTVGQGNGASTPAGSSASSSSSSSTGSSSGSDAGSDSSARGGTADSTGTTSGGTGSSGSNSGAAGAATGSGSGSGSGGRLAKCRTGDLKITATDTTIDGDPDATVAVEMLNNSGRDCVMTGYAGVDLKTDAGSQSAERTSQASSTTAVIKSGKATAFFVEYPFNKTGGSGVRITGLVVTPPDETTSVTLAWPGEPSLPVTDGSGSPVKVGPVGSAGQGG